MAETIHHQPGTSQFTEIVSGTGNEFFVQNVSKSPKASVMLVWGVAVPAQDTWGHVVERGEAVVRSGLTGKVYARAMTTDCIVAVSEE